MNVWKEIGEFWCSLTTYFAVHLVAFQERRKMQELHCSRKDSLALGDYAVRFLKHNSSDVLHSQAEAPMTPDRVSDFGTTDISWEDHVTEVCNEINATIKLSIFCSVLVLKFYHLDKLTCMSICIYWSI